MVLIHRQINTQISYYTNSIIILKMQVPAYLIPIFYSVLCCAPCQHYRKGNRHCHRHNANPRDRQWVAPEPKNQPPGTKLHDKRAPWIFEESLIAHLHRPVLQTGVAGLRPRGFPGHLPTSCDFCAGKANIPIVSKPVELLSLQPFSRNRQYGVYRENLCRRWMST